MRFEVLSVGPRIAYFGIHSGYGFCATAWPYVASGFAVTTDRPAASAEGACHSSGALLRVHHWRREASIGAAPTYTLAARPDRARRGHGLRCSPLAKAVVQRSRDFRGDLRAFDQRP